MDQTTIDLKLPDGSTNQIQLFHPSDKKSPSLVVIFPALGVRASYYKVLAEGFAKAGMIAATVDLRGNGTSSVKVSSKVDFGYKDIIDLDYVAAIDALARQFPTQKMYLFGHSLGGQLGALYVSRFPGKVAGLILVACCSLYYKSWDLKGRLRLLLGVRVFRMVTSLLGYFPGKKLGFGGTEAKTQMLDWCNQALTGRYELKNETYDYEESLRKMSTPTLAISFQEDHYAPVEAVRHLYGKFKNPDEVTHHVLTADQINGKGFVHFSWAKEPKVVIDKILAWDIID